MTHTSEPRGTEDEPAAAFFAATEQAFTQAAAKTGLCEKSFVFAGLRIRLRFAGPDVVAPFMRALAQHPEQEGPAALTINVWDLASSGVKVPRPAWSWDAGIGRGEIPGLDSGSFRIALDPVGRAISAYDVGNQTAYFWVHDAQRLPFQINAAPFRTILHWWTILRGRQLAHAAAVGTPQGGCLLVGKAGAGKSTTAVASLLAGCGYLGDDCCIVGTLNGPYAWNAYGSSKLNNDTLARFQELGARIANPERQANDKAVVYVSEVFPERLLEGFPIRALVVPRITNHAHCTARRISPAAGFVALAPSTIFQLPLADSRSSSVLADVAARVPCYELCLSSDPFDAVEVLRGLWS